MEHLKLFVWDEFCTARTDGLAFAIAKNEDDARRLVRARYGTYEPYQWGTLTVYELTHEIARCVLGAD